MNPLELIRLHMELECISLNQAGDLIPFPCDNPDDIHQLYIARHDGGYSRFFRHDLPPDLRAALAKLSDEMLFHECTHVQSIFAESGAPCHDMNVGRSYIYPEIFEAVTFPDVTCLPENDLCAILMDSVAVSACSSIRHNEYSAEAWVFTEEACRRQGFGKRVVQAWAQRVRQQGRIPFYSHRMDNPASQRLAESIDFEWYVDDVGYE